jgi:hypothetical protein
MLLLLNWIQTYFLEKSEQFTAVAQCMGKNTLVKM